MSIQLISQAKTSLSCLLLAVLLLLAPHFGLTPSHAGDAAEFRAHGFSSDEAGRYFAFEEFGSQDGSGFPYSNIYIVDLKEDKWVPGTPVRVLIEDENQTPLAARVSAFQQATSIMQQYDITRAGVMMAASPLNEVSDKSTLSFHQAINPLLSNQPAPYKLQLSNIDVTDLNDCGFANNRVMGFALSMVKPDGSHVDIHDEGSAPKSRGCPERYHLVAVFAPDRYRVKSYAVALVGVFSRGFEGPDLRYIAVPFSF
nr:DUF2259 domain-containing protein [uncultured Cohaesibacter sp.]